MILKRGRLGRMGCAARRSDARGPTLPGPRETLDWPFTSAAAGRLPLGGFGKNGLLVFLRRWRSPAFLALLSSSLVADDHLHALLSRRCR